jgi:hypothetical protein
LIGTKRTNFRCSFRRAAPHDRSPISSPIRRRSLSSATTRDGSYSPSQSSPGVLACEFPRRPAPESESNQPRRPANSPAGMPTLHLVNRRGGMDHQNDNCWHFCSGC